jgi:hypothetical protein
MGLANGLGDCYRGFNKGEEEKAWNTFYILVGHMEGKK